MKFLIAIVTIVTGFVSGQNSKLTMQCEKVLDTLTNREIYNSVDTQPNVNGGLNALFDEIGALKIPMDPDIDQIRIHISFIVELNGDISGFRTINKIKSSTLDEELLQLIRKYKWEPALCKGLKVPTRLTIRIVS